MRNPVFTILKALAIVLVVLSQTGVPAWLIDLGRMCAIPAFFICAGYCFKTKYLADERTFVVHRLKGLYLPFVIWSVVILCLHNFFHLCGLLSETYGDSLGQVSKPFTFNEFSQHLWSVVFNMSGYDAFICSSFWFFRALLFASLAFLVLLKIFNHTKGNRFSLKRAGWGTLLLAFALLLWQVCSKLHLTGIALGGSRELWGLFFMAAGFLLAQYNVVEKILNWKVALPAFVVWVLSLFFFPTDLLAQPTYSQLFLLPVSALAGFLVLAYCSVKLAVWETFVKRGLIYIGNHTLYIFAFHILAFKLVSIFKVAYYGLPWEAVSGYPYVREPGNNLLFVAIYLLAGISLPLLCREAWLHYAPKLRISFSKEQVLNACLVVVQSVLLACAWIFRFLLRCCRGVVRFFVSCFKTFVAGIKAILDASSTKEE